MLYNFPLIVSLLPQLIRNLKVKLNNFQPNFTKVSLSTSQKKNHFKFRNSSLRQSELSKKVPCQTLAPTELNAKNLTLLTVISNRSDFGVELGLWQKQALIKRKRRVEGPPGLCSKLPGDTR